MASTCVAHNVRGGFILAVGVVVFGAVLPARLADIDDRVSGRVGNSASVN